MNADTVIYPFENINLSFGLKITGHIQLNNDTSLVRAVLITDSGDEFMLYEAYPLITQASSFDISDACDETCFLNNINPATLRFEIIDAEITIDYLSNSTDAIQNAAVMQDLEKRKIDYKKVEKIENNLNNLGFEWTPGYTDVVKWYYAKKKQFWGEKYNLLGYDYYSGGIYQAAGVDYANITYNPYVNVWDWRNRHHANDPSSPYFDGDDIEFTGWLTSIKNQSDPAGCGSCSAFGTFGSFEAMINLYYNQHLDFNLSEQEQLSCNPQISCQGGHPNAIFPYIRDNGVVTEDCFPYQADDQIPCSDKCQNPDPTVTLSSYEEHSEGNFSWNQIQEMLITKGPLVWIKSGGTHAIALIGYIYDDDNDKLYLIQKESLGPNWGQNGNGFLIDPAPVDYKYVGAALDASIITENPPDRLLCDEDGDGYDNWGIGPRPEGASQFEDCDDSNAGYTKFEDDYSCHCYQEFSGDHIIIYNGEDIYWTENQALNKDVTIKYGGKLTITAKIYIQRGVDFIVEPGGQLFIDGGYLTKACDKFWKGIEVWGDKNKPQLNTSTPSNPYSNQGYISITNGGIIEYAKIGVLTGEVDDYGVYDYDKSGGIVKAADAVFRNNIVDVRFLPYFDETDPLNLSNFSNDTFITYDKELTLFIPEVHLYLDGVYGVNAIGCDFIYKYNNIISPVIDDKGIGILAKDAQFAVRSYCIHPGTQPPCTDDSCSFVDLRYGIKAFNTGSNTLIQVFDTKFDSCTAGIYISGYSRP